MRRNLFLIGIVAAVLAAGACKAGTETERAATTRAAQRDAAVKTQAAGEHASDDHHGHSHGKPGEVPAFQTDPESLKSLPATLSPVLFSGKQREAYRMVKEIPETIAQLPCYCHCDKGFGHKSLHSCFVDDHAAHCAVCVDEAVLAYKLQKEEKLKPEQIRERIIAQYSKQF